MKVLAIDWSYFMPLDEGIVSYFPNAGVSDAMATMQWARSYASAKKDGKDLTKLQVRSKELDKVRDRLNKQIRMFGHGCSTSLVHLGEFLLDKSLEDKINKEGLDLTVISNKVFDGDYNGSNLSENNWLTAVTSKYSSANISCITQSDQSKFKSISIDDLDEEYSMIYLCRTSSACLPHLDKEFSALARFLAKRANAVLLKQEMPGRYDSDMQKEIKAISTNL